MKVTNRDSITFMVGAIFGIVMWIVALDIQPERKHTIFSIGRQLELGMDYETVKNLIRSHDAPFLRTIYRDESIWVYANLGAAQSCGLLIEFTDGVLATAKIRGEDGDHEVYSDAPPDLSN